MVMEDGVCWLCLTDDLMRRGGGGGARRPTAWPTFSASSGDRVRVEIRWRTGKTLLFLVLHIHDIYQVIIFIEKNNTYKCGCEDPVNQVLSVQKSRGK